MLTLLLYQYKPYSTCNQNASGTSWNGLLLGVFCTMFPSQPCCFKPYRISMHVCSYRHPHDSWEHRWKFIRHVIVAYAYFLKPLVPFDAIYWPPTTFNLVLFWASLIRIIIANVSPVVSFVCWIKKKISCLWK